MAQDSACIAGCASSIDDIIVTATRRDSSVISVPLSVAASDRERLDRDRVTNIADLARTTPGLSIRNGWGDSTKISIRGIASSVGTATTGIYLDDTPIQVRSLGRSEEHTSELQSLMRISYAVFCLITNTQHLSTNRNNTNST